MHFSSAALALLAATVSATPLKHVHVHTKVVTQYTTLFVNAPAATQPAVPEVEVPKAQIAEVKVEKPKTKAKKPKTKAVKVKPSTTSTAAAAPTYAAPSDDEGDDDDDTTGTTGGGATIKFRTLDNQARIIIFTPDNTTGSASAPIDDLEVGPGKTPKVTLPYAWQGNWYAINKGEEREPSGVLGEIACNGYAGAHYFDVSTEKNHRKDLNGVKQLFPVSSKKPMSGCNSFPCNNAYVCPDDELTKATNENVLIQTLGEGTGYDMTDAEYWAADTRILTTCAVRTTV